MDNRVSYAVCKADCALAGTLTVTWVFIFTTHFLFFLEEAIYMAAINPIALIGEATNQLNNTVQNGLAQFDQAAAVCRM